MAIGIPAVTIVGVALWTLDRTPSLSTSLPIALAMLALAAAARQVVLQLGPRSWYTASTPIVVLAALLGGPLLGVAAGVASQIVRPDAVWRRRSAEGGVVALQGLVAGIAGLAFLEPGSPTPARTIMAVAVGMLAAVAVNAVCRLLIILERHPGKLSDLWARGLRVDLLETVLVVPSLSVLLIAETRTPELVATTLASLLTVLLLAQRSRQTAAAALAAEQETARRDQLTGAPNRRAFEEAMAAEHARIVRGAVPTGLFVIDLDRFKSVNDRFGHSVGDEVLTAVVRRLTEGLRPHDTVARWGGEEITVLAPGVKGRRQLEQTAERIRTLVNELPIATSTTALCVTVSVGATLLDGSVTPATAFRRADGALYEAKRTRDASAIALPPQLTLRLETA